MVSFHLTFLLFTCIHIISTEYGKLSEKRINAGRENGNSDAPLVPESSAPTDDVKMGKSSSRPEEQRSINFSDDVASDSNKFSEEYYSSKSSKSSKKARVVPPLDMDLDNAPKSPSPVRRKTSVTTAVHTEFDEDHPEEGFVRHKTSSELVSNLTDEVQGHQEKIASFIQSLKEGDIATKETSQFRHRRLTFSQQTAENPEPPTPITARVKRTTIFASSELGVKLEKKPPFPEEYMGTYSCHGVEPSKDADDEDGIHEKINQDRGCIVHPFRGSPNETLFMVLDGHGEQGDRISEFVMRQIVVSLEKSTTLDEDPVKALEETFTHTNTALMVTPMQYMTSGTTCVAVYMKGLTLWVANCGDSRAVMAIDDRSEEEKAKLTEQARIEWEEKTQGLDEYEIEDLGNMIVGGLYTAKTLSRDHKPDDPEEAARITEWGGYIYHPPEPGLSSRVYLDPEHTVIGLAMARSIGDFAVKEVGVIASPEVRVFQLSPQDKFMILASDGVWEFITSQEAVDIVGSNLEHGCHAACEELIQIAATRWAEEEGDYRDDITAIVVKFPLPHQPPYIN